MFSARLHWDTRQNQLSQLLESKRRAGARILDLTESNPTRAGFSYSPEITAALDDPRALRYDPAPAGMEDARRAVAAYYAERDYDVDPARILLTASTSEAYANLFKLLCDPGDRVMVPRPSYPLFDFLARLEAVDVDQYPLAYHGAWSLDLDALTQEVSDRTRAVVLVNPNNPTGSFIKRHELRALIQLCAERNLVLISDEVFADYSFQPDTSRVSSLVNVTDCLAFSMSGLSKIAGLPQMKLGWIVASGPERLRRDALEKLEWIADTYLSVNTPVQCAAGRLLEAGQAVQAEIRERTQANLAAARTAFAGSAINILNVEGGWYITLQVPRLQSEEEWTLDLLAACDVLVQPGFFFDFSTEAFLVVSLLTRPDTFEEGIRRIVSRLNRGV